MTDQPIEALAAEMKAKSLGEKLSDAIRYRRETLKPRFWNHTSDTHKTDFEQVALAFAASLSHDETASVVIAAQAEEIADLKSELRETEMGAAMLARERREALAKLVESEAREGALRDLLGKTAAIAQLAASGRRIMECDLIVFNGKWAHLGAVGVKETLDAADAALTTQGRGE